MNICKKGLICLNIPKSSIDIYYNDIILEQAINNCDEELIIYLSGDNNNDVYVETICPRIWDIVNCKDKTKLRIKIIPGYLDDTFQSYDSLLLIPDLSMLFLQTIINYEEREVINKKREELHLLPIVFYSLESFLQSYKINEMCEFVEDHPIKKYDHVCLGGTFDYLHLGHQLLLLYACKYTNKELHIGVFDHKNSGKSFQDKMESYEIRKQNVENYIKLICPSIKCSIIQITTSSGSASEVKEYNAIMVSSETIKNAYKINEERIKKGFEPLKILILLRKDNYLLSSTFIRSKK